MRMYVISDSLDVITGMRLAGVEGTLVKGREEALDALRDIRKTGDIGIILVTYGVAEKIREEISAVKLEKSMPVVTIIPDRNKGIKDNYITDYIKQSIGLKI